MLRTLSFFLIISLFSTPSLAKYVTPLAGPGVEITKYFTHESGGVTLYISGNKINLDNCAATYRVYIPHDLDPTGRNSLASAALTAFVSGKKIGLHASKCQTTPFWGGTEEVPIINNLWIFK